MEAFRTSLVFTRDAAFFQRSMPSIFFYCIARFSLNGNICSEYNGRAEMWFCSTAML